MEEKSFNITKLLDVVQKNGLLFYPVIIYLITEFLQDNGQKIVPVHVVCDSAGKPVLRSVKQTSNFADFFQNYAQDCYKVLTEERRELALTEGKKPVLISYLNKEETSALSKDISTIYISCRLDQKMMCLSFGRTDFPNDWKAFQEKCDSFNV